MIGIVRWLVLGLGVALGARASAQSPAPQAYTLKARGTFADREMTLTIVRDGAKERVERTIGPASMTSLYDFAAHRVYWIGWSGAGTCSSGRYLSARAPVSEDPVTGTAESLAELADGRTSVPAGTGTVAGLAARIESFPGGKMPAGTDAPPLPNRVWLAQQGGYLLKVEGVGAKGKPVTLIEVTQLTFERPKGAALEPPADCISTNSVMEDTGSIRSHAESSVTAEASGSADLATGKTTGSASARTDPPAAARPLAKLEGLTLEVAEQAGDGKCGRKLVLTGSLSVDGAATVDYRLQPSVGGLMFVDGPGGTLTVDAAGSATVVKEAGFLRPLKGAVKLQAIVKGANGHNGPMKFSAAVPFEVTCAGK